MGIGKRIKELREFKKLKQDELAKMVGVTASAIGNYETEVSHPKEHVLYKLIEVLDCDANFLFQDAIPINFNDNFSYEEKNYIKKYRTLDEHGKKVIDLLLDEEHNRMQLNELKKMQNKNKVKFIERPCSAYSTSAGVGLKIFDDIETFPVKLESNNMTIMSDLILHINGNSMEPKFYDDEYVAIKYQPTVAIGEVGIFIVNGDSYIKKLGTDRLISINKNYEDILFNENDSILCSGKVLGTVEICQ